MRLMGDTGWAVGLYFSDPVNFIYICIIEFINEKISFPILPHIYWFPLSVACIVNLDTCCPLIWHYCIEASNGPFSP